MNNLSPCGKTKLNLLLCSIFVNLIMINALFIWYNPGINDGFVLERLGVLIAQYSNNSNIFVRGFDTFPFSPCYLLVSHLITNLDVISFSFLPIIPLFSILPIMVFSKIFFEKDTFSFFISMIVCMYVFGKVSHYSEYFIAYFMFFYFMHSFYKYYTSHKLSYFILILLFYIGVKFFGPPMEIWTVAFVLLIVVLMYCTQKCIKLSPNLNTLILFIVLLLIYNPKFYTQFLVREISIFNIFPNFYDFIISMLTPEPTINDLIVIPSPSPIAKYTKMLYIFFSSAPIVGKISYDLIAKDFVLWKYDQKTLYGFALILVFFADCLLYASVGVVILRYIVLIYPIIGVYFCSKLLSNNKKYFILYTFLLITLAFCSNVFTIQFERYPYSEDVLNSNTVWVKEYVGNSNIILTDHYTYTSMIASSSNLYNNFTLSNTVSYTNERYKEIISSEKMYPLDFNYLIVDIESLNLPIKQGPPSWVFFEPLYKHYSSVNDNIKLCKVFVNGEYQIYSTNEHIT